MIAGHHLEANGRWRTSGADDQGLGWLDVLVPEPIGGGLSHGRGGFANGNDVNRFAGRIGCLLQRTPQGAAGVDLFDHLTVDVLECRTKVSVRPRRHAHRSAPGWMTQRG